MITLIAWTRTRKAICGLETNRGATRFDGKSFTNYGAKDGFSDKDTWTILCDSKGYIWFGTKGDGLFRFDGEKRKQFWAILLRGSKADIQHCRILQDVITRLRSGVGLLLYRTFFLKKDYNTPPAPLFRGEPALLRSGPGLESCSPGRA